MILLSRSSCPRVVCRPKALPYIHLLNLKQRSRAMADSEAQRPWVPKQIPTMDGEWYKMIGGDTTKAMARHIFAAILDPLPPDTVMHDAAAGQAPFTDAALAACPAASLPSLRLACSDVSPQMLDFARATVARHGQVRADQTTFEVLDACNLSPAFRDGHFTLTALTFGLAIMPSPQAAAAEMYRTLAPGGTAVSAFWSQQPTGWALTDAHHAMRAPGRRLKMDPPRDSGDPEVLRAYLKAGGFAHVDMHFHTVVHDVPDVRRYVNGLWPIIGEPADGWQRQDEDEWEACIDRAVEILRSAKGVTDLGGGHIKVEMIGMIAVAKK